MDEHGSRAQALRLRERGLEWRTVMDEVVALDLDDSVYLAVNRSGAVLWEALEAGASEDDLAQRLVDRYSILLDDALADVRAFIAALAAHSLLEP